MTSAVIRVCSSWVARRTCGHNAIWATRTRRGARYDDTDAPARPLVDDGDCPSSRRAGRRASAERAVASAVVGFAAQHAPPAVNLCPPAAIPPEAAAIHAAPVAIPARAAAV